MKKLFLSIFSGIVFIILICILVVGVGSKAEVNGKSSDGLSKYDIKPNAIIFNNENKDGPIIEVYITSQKKVKDMCLEEYVRGVVSAEMPAEFNIEALKAQAVAARTFAMAHMEDLKGEKSGDPENADVCDTSHCQAYIGKDERLASWPKANAGQLWNKVTDAVTQTRGQYLSYDGELVMEPYYFSTSSGRTENSEDVFNQDIPYLKSVLSPGEESSNKFKTTIKVRTNDFIYRINSAYPKSKLSLSNLKNQIYILSRSEGGSVKNIKTGKITMTGTNFRNIFNLDSSNFIISINNSNVLITCKGYGHDVGMSQWGANAMAKSGSKYMDILKHYYQGINIDKLEYAK